MLLCGCMKKQESLYDQTKPFDVDNREGKTMAKLANCAKCGRLFVNLNP